MGVRIFGVSIAAFVLGALGTFAVAGGFADEAPTEASLETTTTLSPVTEPAGTFFVDPHETRIGSSVIVPTVLEVRDDTVNLTYDVVSLAPGAEEAIRVASAEEAGFESFQPDTPPIYALDWVLTTTDGTEIRSTISNSEVTIARFQTESPLTLEDIESITIARYLVATPLEVAVMFSQGPPVEVFPGVTLSFVNRSNLDNQTAIEIQSTALVPLQAQWIFIIGEGPDWATSSRSNQFGGNWTVVWNSTDLADDFPIRVLGTAWIVEDEPVQVSIGGVR